MSDIWGSGDLHACDRVAGIGDLSNMTQTWCCRTSRNSQSSSAAPKHGFNSLSSRLTCVQRGDTTRDQGDRPRTDTIERQQHRHGASSCPFDRFNVLNSAVDTGRKGSSSMRRWDGRSGRERQAMEQAGSRPSRPGLLHWRHIVNCRDHGEPGTSPPSRVTTRSIGDHRKGYIPVTGPCSEPHTEPCITHKTDAEQAKDGMKYVDVDT